jgi:hypothetical protein
MVSEFNALGLYDAMEAQRADRGLSWRQVAAELWEQSDVLNASRRDHPISASTLTGIATRHDCTCQHALFILRWLGRTPESFLVPQPPAREETRLPVVGRDQRLRWDLAALAQRLDERRQERGLTWKALATELRCSSHQAQGLRTIRYAIGMRLAMRIVQWVEQPAAAFIYGASW